MKIAVMADIHGNLPAFEAAVEDYRKLGADLLIIGGDVVNGAPDSADCWALATSLNAPIIRGNHERYVGLFGSADAPAEWLTERFGPVRWSAAQFSPAEKQVLTGLPLKWTHSDLPDLFFCHSSVRSDSDAVAAYTSDAELDAMFPQIAAPLIIRGHNHAPAIRFWRNSRIVTTGSVGLTLDGIPSAQYVVLTQSRGAWHIEHRSVEYDIDSALARFHDTGYLTQGGPMARLFYREVATASFHIVPFMRMYDRWSAGSGISLDAAVDRFLAL
jgi:predicted phosphodiesterase